MNNVQLREFDSFTLDLVSKCIDTKVQELREIHPQDRTPEQLNELTSLLGFQTQTLYAAELVKREQKVMNQ